MVDERNKAETLVYQTEKLLRDQAEKISAEDRDAVESKLTDLKKALDGNDVAAVRTATDLLMNASQEFTTKLYQQAADIMAKDTPAVPVFEVKVNAATTKAVQGLVIPPNEFIDFSTVYLTK